MAGVAVIGQPNIAARRLENPIEVPGALSFLAYGTFQSYVRGLDEFPEDQWPDNIELLYYSFHLMITLGAHHHKMAIAFLLPAVLGVTQQYRPLETGRVLLWLIAPLILRQQSLRVDTCSFLYTSSRRG